MYTSYWISKWEFLPCPPPHVPNLKVELRWFNCAPVGLNSVAIIFNCATLNSKYAEGRRGGETLASIVILNAESPGINGALLVLNCADIIFNCAGLHLSRHKREGFGAQPSARVLEWKWSQEIDFQLCSNHFNLTRLLSEIWASSFNICAWDQWAKFTFLAPNRKHLQIISFWLCSIVQQSFWIVLASFLRFGHLLPMYTHEVNDPSPSLWPFSFRVSIS